LFAGAVAKNAAYDASFVTLSAIVTLALLLLITAMPETRHAAPRPLRASGFI
jgi:hypothetical protein